MKNSIRLAVCLLITAAMLVPTISSAGRPPPADPVNFLFGDDWDVDNYIIIVGNTDYASYSAAIWQHYNDTTGDYAVRVYQDKDEGQDAIRAWLSTQYDTYGAFHLLLVSNLYDIDLGYFEDVSDQFGGWNSPYTFPLLEKYYNLDGNFKDIDSDGKYDWLDDKKTAPLYRELYVGVMVGSGDGLTENFTKIHKYLTNDQTFMRPDAAVTISSSDLEIFNVNESVELVYSTNRYVTDGDHDLHIDVANDDVSWAHFQAHGYIDREQYWNATTEAWENVTWDENAGNFGGHIALTTGCGCGGIYYYSPYYGYMNNDYSVCMLAYPKGAYITDYGALYTALSQGKTIGEAANIYEDAAPQGAYCDWGLTIYGPPILTV